MKSQTDIKTRQHEHRVEINASPETVWEAITEPGNLKNWFPIEAEVRPGPEGEIDYSWGPDLAGTWQIRIWEPRTHLQTTWIEHAGPDFAEGGPLIVDWFLEGERGKTRLRLVHSGFGMGRDWDAEYDGTNRGWEFELYSLKHYIERHLGTPRRVIWIRRPVSMEAPQVWDRLVDRPDGLLKGVGSKSLRQGGPVEMTLSSGDGIEGTLVQYLPPTDMAFTATNWNQALLRTGFENCGAGPEGHIWCSLWGVSEREAAAFERRLEQAIDRALA